MTIVVMMMMMMMMMTDDNVDDSNGSVATLIMTYPLRTMMMTSQMFSRTSYQVRVNKTNLITMYLALIIRSRKMRIRLTSPTRDKHIHRLRMEL